MQILEWLENSIDSEDKGEAGSEGTPQSKTPSRHEIDGFIPDASTILSLFALQAQRPLEMQSPRVVGSPASVHSVGKSVTVGDNATVSEADNSVRSNVCT